MVTTMCLNSRLDDRHQDQPEGVPLLSDLPARGVFADTVPAIVGSTLPHLAHTGPSGQRTLFEVSPARIIV
jgi:hypothetical protein